MVSDLGQRNPFEVLSRRGWLVEFTATGSAMPPRLRRRYPHLPAHFAALLGTIETCRNPRDDAWIFGSAPAIHLHLLSWSWVGWMNAAWSRPTS